jgi:hypothetical protein
MLRPGLYSCVFVGLLGILHLACDSGPSREQLQDQYRDRLKKLYKLQMVVEESAKLNRRLIGVQEQLPSRLENEELIRQLQSSTEPCSVTLIEIGVVAIDKQAEQVRRTTELTMGAGSYQAAICQLTKILRFDTMTTLESLQCNRRPDNLLSCHLKIIDWWLTAPEPLAGSNIDLGRPHQTPEDKDELKKEISRLDKTLSKFANKVTSHHAKLKSRQNAILAYQRQKGSEEKLLPVLQTITSNDFELKSFTLKPNRLELAGAVANASYKEKLQSLAVPEGFTIDLALLKVDPQLTPQDLDQLAWLSPKQAKPKAKRVQVHAVEAEGQWLQALLFRGDVAIIVKSASGIPISGRLEVSSSKAALQVLEGLNPALKTVSLKRGIRRGRGRKVDLFLINADPANIFKLLGEVGGLSIGVPSGLPRISVQVKFAPFDNVLQAIADVLDLRIKQPSKGKVLLQKPGDSKPLAPIGHVDTADTITAFRTLPKFLDGLRLSATVVDNKRAGALFQSVTGDHFLIFAGRDMHSPGRTFQIEPGRVLVEEAYRDPFGKENVKTREFRLRRKYVSK